MKKILNIVLLIVCVLGFSNIKNVSATTIDKLQNVNIEKREQDGTIYLSLKGVTSENLEIQSGEKVVLDLNGHTLNNTTKTGELTVDLPTIKIAQGGTLTIRGKGSITRTDKYSESILQQAIIDNYGTLNLDLEETGFISPQVAAVYGIYNHDSGELNMTGGRISTMNNSTYGLWNEGTANISGGRFDQNNYIVGDDYANQPAIINSPTGKLNISGGEFINMTGQEVPTVAPINGSETTITGGKFEYQDPKTYATKSQNISSYLPSGYKTDNYGNVIKNEPTTKPTETTTTSATTTGIIEEQTTTKEETATLTNPKTLDNILVYVGLAAMSLSAVGYVGYIIRKKVNN